MTVNKYYKIKEKGMTLYELEMQERSGAIRKKGLRERRREVSETSVINNKILKSVVFNEENRSFFLPIP